MRSDAEGEVLARFAVDVEFVTVGTELAVVSTRRREKHHHHAAFGHGLAVQGDVTRHVPRGVWSRRLVAQQFLDGLGDEGRILGEFAALAGVFRENLSPPNRSAAWSSRCLRPRRR